MVAMPKNSRSLDRLSERLSAIVGTEYVRVNPSWQDNTYTIPSGVTVYPKDEEELIAVVRFAHAERLTIAPQGGGTKDALGLLKERPDILLSMQRIAGIVDHPAEDMTVTVLPGTTVKQLQTVLAKHSQFLPISSPWPEQSTIGGSVSANVTGPKRAMYGSARDLVLGARIVYPDGTLIRTGAKTVKNVAGYDMNKLFIGAMGTLGIISELTFKLRPLPKFAAAMIVTHSEADPLKKLQFEILDSHLEPAALEFVNSALLQKLGIHGKRHALVIAFEDVEKSVKYQLDWIAKQALLHEITVSEHIEQQEAADFWNKYLQILPNSLFVDPDKCIVSLKISCLLTQIQDVMCRIEQLALEQGLPVMTMGGGTTGIGHAVMETPAEHMEKAVEWIALSRSLLNGANGHLVIEFAPNSIRSRLPVWGEERIDFKLMRAIKGKIDPLRILNPGRYVGGI